MLIPTGKISVINRRSLKRFGAQSALQIVVPMLILGLDFVWVMMNVGAGINQKLRQLAAKETKPRSDKDLSLYCLLFNKEKD